MEGEHLYRNERTYAEILLPRHSDDQQQQQRRELLEILARQPSFLDQIKHFPAVFEGLKQAREVDGHVGRDLKDVLDKIDLKEFANRVIVTRSLNELD